MQHFHFFESQVLGAIFKKTSRPSDLAPRKFTGCLCASLLQIRKKIGSVSKTEKDGARANETKLETT